MRNDGRGSQWDFDKTEAEVHSTGYSDNVPLPEMDKLTDDRAS